ncbi:MAG: hypothetical protein AB1650_03255 [Candidatus Omnitrophota bacterium]
MDNKNITTGRKKIVNLPSSFLTHLVYLLIPLCLWIIFFWPALTGKIFVGGKDNPQYAHWILYFFDNLQQGVFPLWNPFHSWGCIDNLDMRFMGEYNPFLYIIPFLRLSGFSDYNAFLTYMIAYFWMGGIGFYLLTYCIFKKKYIAFSAYSFFLFSGYGIHFLKYQLIDLLITVPIIWFFYFLISFVETPRKKHLLGITITLMLTATTYIPFPFLLVTSITLISTVLILRRKSIRALSKGIAFLSRRKSLAIFCLFCLTLSAVPIIAWRMSSFDPQYVIEVERGPGGDSDTVEVSQNAVNKASIPAMTNLDELFDNLDISVQVMPFVSIFLYIALLLCAFTRMRGRSYIFFLSFFIILVISSADAFPVHPWLFKHVNLFRLFRNYLHLFPTLIALAILFLMDRLESFYMEKPAGLKQKYLLSAWGILAAGSSVLFLNRFDHIIISSYLTIVSVLIFFLVFIWRTALKQRTFFIAITVIGLIQPFEFFYHTIPMLQSKLLVNDHLVRKTHFSYTRPEEGNGLNEDHSFHYRYKILKDESGFTHGGYFGLKYVQDLHQRIRRPALQNYVKNKFYVYNHWTIVDPGSEPWKDLERTLSDENAPALIFENDVPGFVKNPAEKRLSPDKDSDILTINAFSVNRLAATVEVPGERLLVYNDTFHSGWRALLDRRPARILRTNYAFKGIIIPAGRHQIEFIYGHPFLYTLSLTLLGITGILWTLTIMAFLKNDDQKNY